MAAHSSILAWRILWTEEPGGLLSMGSHRVRHDLAAAAAHMHVNAYQQTVCRGWHQKKASGTAFSILDPRSCSPRVHTMRPGTGAALQDAGLYSASSCKAVGSCVSWLPPGGRSLDHSSQIQVRKDCTHSSFWSQERLSALQLTSNTMQNNLTTFKKF